MLKVMSVVVLAAAVAAEAHAAPQVAHRVNAEHFQSCKMEYGGGPMLQNVRVFDVFYNQGNPNKSKLEDFYKYIVTSPHFDWLTEYNVSNYKIGHGTFEGSYEDSKSGSETLDAKDIGPYLDKLISDKKIPEPDDNMIYQVHFPSSVTLTLQGSQSCAQGGFCAFHYSWDHGGQKARFSALPDVSSGGCKGHCGKNSDEFDNLTEVSSHELIEAVTDPDDNSAWVDKNKGCGEIGDICNGQAGKVGMFTVQKEWSNKNNSCIVMDPNTKVNDFTMAVSPTMLSIPAGGMATASVTLTKTGGDAENVTLSVAQPPTGLSASVAPTSVSSDKGMATLTVAASATAMMGMQKVTVKAMGTSASPTVDVTVMVTAPADMAVPPDMTQSGGGSGGSGGSGGGSGGSGGSGGGSGGSGGAGGSHTGGAGSGGNGTGTGTGSGSSSSGCAIGAGPTAASWLLAFVALALVARRRRRA